MKNSLALLLLLATLAPAAEFRDALPGYSYQFPRDHFNHPEFKTEWWYYTGNLRDPSGHRFGFELTFFRVAADRDSKPGPWDVPDVWMAHLALSDITGRRFFHTERLNRPGVGLAGADDTQARVWNGNWQAQWRPDSSQQLEAVAPEFSFRLTATPQKPPVIHGANGISQKAAGPGHASHYISLTRLATHGTITLEATTYTVDGLSWMDHEFFTNNLAGNEAGWDWLSIQFADNTELMLYQLRRKDGTRDPYSSATFVDAQGHSTHLTASEFTLTPGAKWTIYPVHWTLSIPSLHLTASISTPLENQELTTKVPWIPMYWEGAIDIESSRGPGTGYLEMTGYRALVSMN